ncbi:MAG: TIGR04282 family arsenosugar biosynthesis glycosyltransferase [Saprospiraceae bacterium]|nr:TIGR04282 family arsenosugar biosynthesis glycosyltransferase [Saprospiraceae bacterium]
MDRALIIFVKNNQPGKVKTRLAKDIGYEKASEIYHWLINYTKYQVSHVATDIYIFYSEYLEIQDQWSGQNVFKMIQQGQDLGERMMHAFQTVFEAEYNQVVIIGSDCYGLETPLIRKAFKKLEQSDMVVGPATDGGYYLLGVKKYYADLFSDKSWSSDQLLSETLAAANKLDLNVSQLKALTDIDYLEDLKQTGLEYLIDED